MSCPFMLPVLKSIKFGWCVMTEQLEDYLFKMNPMCEVCHEPAAGYHFGAFTCEGCKSFFGRSYNNICSIQPCKNTGTCLINKKTRTSCKACRLRKCLEVGMSKGNSIYGRRSNYFKITCLLNQSYKKRPMDRLLPTYKRWSSCNSLRRIPASSSPESHISDNSESPTSPVEEQSSFDQVDYYRTPVFQYPSLINPIASSLPSHLQPSTSSQVPLFDLYSMSSILNTYPFDYNSSAPIDLSVRSTDNVIDVHEDNQDDKYQEERSQTPPLDLTKKNINH